MNKLIKAWKKEVPSLNTEDTTATFPGKCSKVINKLKPFGIQMNGYVFEIPPSAYLEELDG